LYDDKQLHIQIMNANSQAQQGHVERAGGIVLNYKNIKDGSPFAGIAFNDGGDEEAGEEDIKVATANIALNEVISGERARGAAEVHPRIEFNDTGDDNAGEEDIKVATENIAVNEMISGECAEGAAEVRPRPLSLAAFGRGRVSNTAATAVTSEGGRIESNMRMLMLSMQMQQMAQQILMRQQKFLQQMQMHMSAMEKHADTSEEYLWRIANFMTTHNNKRKRDGINEEDNYSSNDDK
jgi:hypothetical protein